MKKRLKDVPQNSDVLMHRFLTGGPWKWSKKIKKYGIVLIETSFIGFRGVPMYLLTFWGFVEIFMTFKAKKVKNHCSTG